MKKQQIITMIVFIFLQIFCFNLTAQSEEGGVNPEIETLLTKYNKKPTAGRAAALGQVYSGTGDFITAANYYRRAAESFRKEDERARAYYNAGTSIIEANRAAMQNQEEDQAEHHIPPIETAIEDLHRSLDLLPDQEDAAFNLEIAKIMLAQKQSREEEQQDGENGEQSEEKQQQESDQDKQSGDRGENQTDNSQDGESGQSDQNQQTQNQDSQSNPENGEENQASQAKQDEEAGDQEESETKVGEASDEEAMSEEEIQERLSEILGNEEENRQLREALLEKRGGINDVERDW
ncbi:MAG: hypothetical protein JEY99_06195 [Spirochaetales bacterium]|nr:hypothetical protein [Spirochaetales bacterium]